MKTTTFLSRCPALFLIFIFCVSAAGCVGLYPPRPDYPLSKEKLSFEIISEKQKYTFDEDLIVHGKITNKSNNTVFLDPPWDWYTSKYLYLKQTKNHQALIDKYLVEDEPVGNASEIVRLLPGETYTCEFKIKLKYYKFKPVPGLYELMINYKNHSRWVENINSWIGEFSSNTIDIELE